MPQFNPEDSLGARSPEEIDAYLRLINLPPVPEQTNYLNNDFRTCLHLLMTKGMEAHPRGTTTRELLNYNITLLNPRNRVITFPERKTKTEYLLGELSWYLNCSKLPDHILPYSKFWANITNSGDEPGYEKGTVNSNYGNRLFGFCALPAFSLKDQWTETIELLKRDKDSRQAIMNIHVPSDRHEGNKDVPCTLTLQWFIRQETGEAPQLHLIVNMRSNDVILGFTNDVFQFTMLQECMLVNLKEHYPDIELGYYFHNAGSMHIYDRHFEMATKIIANPNAYDLTMIPMDRFDEKIIIALGFLQEDWQRAGGSEDYDFTKRREWSDLSPYWQTLVQAFFNKDEAAMHAIFGQKEDEHA